MEDFLKTDDAHALIVEDDVTLGKEFEAVITAALAQAKHWNVLRLSGLGDGKPRKIAHLLAHYDLCVGFGRLKGTGAYLLDRVAAKAWSTDLLPTRLPIDHALDREWASRLKAATIHPFPASQTEAAFRSSIQVGKSLKLSKLRRYLATYPYQALNELTRWIYRGWQYVQAVKKLAPTSKS